MRNLISILLVLFSRLSFASTEGSIADALETALPLPLLTYMQNPTFGNCPSGYNRQGSLEPQKGVTKILIIYNCVKSKQTVAMHWETTKHFISMQTGIPAGRFCVGGKINKSTFGNSKKFEIYLSYGEALLDRIEFQETDTTRNHLFGAITCLSDPNELNVIAFKQGANKTLDYCKSYLYRGKILPETEECPMYKDIPKNYEMFTKEVVCMNAIIDVENKLGRPIHPHLLAKWATSQASKIQSESIATVSWKCRESYLEDQAIPLDKIMQRNLYGGSIEWKSLDTAAGVYLKGIPLGLSYSEESMVPVVAQASASSKAEDVSNKVNLCKSNPKYLSAISSKDFQDACRECELQKGFDCTRINGHILRYITKKIRQPNRR